MILFVVLSVRFCGIPAVAECTSSPISRVFPSPPSALPGMLNGGCRRSFEGLSKQKKLLECYVGKWLIINVNRYIFKIKCYRL
jgi:hypothetical protein